MVVVRKLWSAGLKVHQYILDYCSLQRDETGDHDFLATGLETMSLTSGPDVTGHVYLDPDHAATVPHWSSDNDIGQIKYSVMQSNGNSFCGDDDL